MESEGAISAVSKQVIIGFHITRECFLRLYRIHIARTKTSSKKFNWRGLVRYDAIMQKCIGETGPLSNPDVKLLVNNITSGVATAIPDCL